MATITIEGVPDALVARLAVAAASNGRCLNSEVIVHLARSAAAAAQPHAHAQEFKGGGCGASHWCGCGGRGRAAVGWGGPAANQLMRGARDSAR